jgi:hypothetical protein
VYTLIGWTTETRTLPVVVERVIALSLTIVSVPRTMLSGDTATFDVGGDVVPAAGGAATESRATLPLEVSVFEHPSASATVGATAIAVRCLSRIRSLQVVV